MINVQKSNILFCSFFVICFLLSFSALLAESTQSDSIQTGTVTGQFLVKDGGTMAGGLVFFFNAETGPPPLFAKHTRVPDIISEIDPENIFLTVLPVGRYYLLAVKKISGGFIGPPQEGDYGYRHMNTNGIWKEFFITKGNYLDLGMLEVKFRGKRVKTETGITAITGFLHDEDGNSIENGLILAFLTPQMQGRKPKFISNRTEKNGEFILHVAGGDKYYLMARDILGGGMLAEGSIIGVYGNPEPVAVAVKDGETVKGIDITVYRMEKRGPTHTIGVDEKIPPEKIGSKKPTVFPLIGPDPPFDPNNNK